MNGTVIASSARSGNGNGKASKREFGTPQKVWDVSQLMQDIEDSRARDRSRINAMMNGQRPYDKAEEKKYNIQINVNFGEGKRIMSDANRQLNNALLHPGTLFNCSCEEGKVDKRQEWGQVFTQEIHKPIQRGRSGYRNHFVVRSRNASVAMHGIGVLHWANRWDLLPQFVPLENFLVPTDTYCDFTNARYFAVNLYWSPGELTEKALGDTSGRHWNKKQVLKILEAHRKYYAESTPSTWKDQPEAMKQIHDQNKGYYYSDAVPKIRLRVFYWRSLEKPHVWYRSIIQREVYGEAKLTEWVYDCADEPFASSVNEIVNVTYGDTNVVAPLLYHSARGLGVDLFAPVELINRLRCEMLWATFENLKMIFRIRDPADRDRLKQVILGQLGFIPDGLEIVPREQRHQIDINLVNTALGQVKELMQENSASFIQQLDNAAPSREMTAREAMARINQANQMIASMLSLIYDQQNFLYEEQVRRACMVNPDDPHIIQFQHRCQRKGIPEELLHNPLAWRVQSERTLGGGDQSLGEARAQWLLQNKTLFDPQSQTTILRMVTSTVLDDPAKGQLLVPSVAPQATDGSRAAANLFGTLMQGVRPKGILTGIDYIGYIEELLSLMEQSVQRITSTDNVGTPLDLIGLITCAQNVGTYMMILQGDPKETQRVRQYSDMLGKLINLVKAFGQRQAQQRQSQQPQMDPKAQASAQATVMNAQIKAKIAADKSQQRQQEKILEFELDQARENIRTLSEIRREDLAHRQKLLNDSMEATVNALRGLSSAKGNPEESN
jgi:hypothetical protein